MKKKIIGIFTVLCLIFPCFFAVACKDKVESSFEPYTYAVTLKNAHGKIDADALASEYDHGNDENVSWTKENNDYKISVTRTSSLSGSVVVNLLEGYDFSSLSFAVNGEQANYSIKSAGQDDCATKAYLTDRQFVYEYEKLKADTSFVLDFSNCTKAKVTLDLTSLKESDVRYCVIEDDFVTMMEGESLITNEFENVDQDTLVVDYGTIIAFDHNEKIVLTNSLNKLQTPSYATYGLRYLMSVNRIQYISASINGKINVYSPVNDPEKNGTLRVLGQAAGLKYTNTLSDITNYSYRFSGQEFEYYEGEMLTMSILHGTKIYIELDEEAQLFNYYLVDQLDEKWQGAIAHQTIAGTDRKYIEIDLSNPDGSVSNAKYLVRKAKSQSNFYMVYANDMSEGTRFTNADYILIGDNNRPSGISSSLEEHIFYGFAKEKDVRVALPAINIDKKTNAGQINLNVEITANNMGGFDSIEREAALVNVDPSTVANVTVDCYLSTDSSRFYSFNFHFEPAPFDENYFSISSDDLHLYEGENIYYSTTPTNTTSWQKFVAGTSLQMYSGEGTSLYYYIDSSRTDADLNLENLKGEKISTSGNSLDCFGRPMTGTATVEGNEIDLSKVRYLDITPGYYNYTFAKLVRAYDNTFHNINTNKVKDKSVKISMDNIASKDDFDDISALENLKIRYTDYNLPGEIYYYVDNINNFELILKDKSGKLVSTSNLVYEDDEPVLVDNNYVYCLSLNAGYYAEDEVFIAEVVEAHYTIVDGAGQTLSFYTSDDGNEELRESQIHERTSYFVTCEDIYRFDICDELGNVVIAWERFTAIDTEVGGIPLYMFTFKIPENTNYLPGTTFKLVKSGR